MQEIWKDVIGYEGWYQVSNLGRVKSLDRVVKYKNGKTYKYKEEIRTLTKDNKGYLRVLVSKNGKHQNLRVHRLVAQAFIPNPRDLSQVNHKDEDKTNNRVDNLEWCDCQYNVDYSLSKPVCQYDDNGNLLRVWKSIIEASRNLQIPDTHIGECCKGVYKQSGGYVWRYADSIGEVYA